MNSLMRYAGPPPIKTSARMHRCMPPEKQRGHVEGRIRELEETLKVATIIGEKESLPSRPVLVTASC